jgi:predicted secreted hydrolase
MANEQWSVLDHVGRNAGLFFEQVANLVVGQAESLRDGSEFDAVVLPRDLAAHKNAQTEWWYYTGHLKTDSGRRFGFELVFFKRRTDLDKFSTIPLRLFGNPLYFAHFALTDHKRKKFRYAHRKSANGTLDRPASASEIHYHLRVGDWSVREAHGAHQLRASLESDIVFEATARPLKPAVLNGREGVSFKDHGEASRYFSFTRMDLEGDLTQGTSTEHFTGTAWMDREFGTWTPTEKQKGWDWFSIQLDNDCELMCYQLRDAKGGVSKFSCGTLVDSDKNFRLLTSSDFSIAATDKWKSARTGTEYPARWKISVPSLELDLEVQPVIEDQELDTRGTTMIVYWEGDCGVAGTIAGSSVSGHAYAELVGYDRSHEKPDLARFLFGGSYDLLSRFIPI